LKDAKFKKTSRPQREIDRNPVGEIKKKNNAGDSKPQNLVGKSSFERGGIFSLILYGRKKRDEFVLKRGERT